MKAKVVKITYKFSDEEQTLFDNGVFSKKSLILNKHLFHGETIGTEQSVEVDLTITLGERRYNRRGIIKCKVSSTEPSGLLGDLIHKVAVHIQATEYKKELLGLIIEQEKMFYLSETELYLDIHNLLKNKYEYVHFKSEVEIDGCIADGLAFVGKSKDYRHAKIVGFEIKTNRDVFDRLYNQVNSYLTICDEVYLVVESKEPPKDLPFYVGIIKIKDGVPAVVRRATTLKHSIDVHDCWKTMLKNLCTHAGIKRDSAIVQFFDTFENMKRKLVWNQFVIGFHRDYTNEYVPLTDDEKRMLKCYFGVVEKGLNSDTENKINYKTLEDFFGKGEEEDGNNN